jgi:hypothetical protein
MTELRVPYFFGHVQGYSFLVLPREEGGDMCSSKAEDKRSGFGIFPETL